jgi:hypothetical protein
VRRVAKLPEDRFLMALEVSKLLAGNAGNPLQDSRGRGQGLRRVVGEWRRPPQPIPQYLQLPKFVR